MSVHESAISVSAWSALKPPNDGTTAPPARRSARIPRRYPPAAVGRRGSPFQAGLHEPRFGAWMKARVRWWAPDRVAMR